MIEHVPPCGEATDHLVVLNDVVQCDFVLVPAKFGAMYEADADVHQVHDAISRFHDRVESIWEDFGGLEAIDILGSLTVQLTEEFQPVEERHQFLAYTGRL